jgi:hypothetical protein
MATAAPTAAPPHAVRCWVDGNNLYFELASQNGPAVIGFQRDAIGLTKALAVLFVRHEVEGHGEVYHRPPSQLPDKDGITGVQRQAARDLLKRMKII